MPRIDFYSDYKLFVKIKLGEGEVLLGRGKECQIQLPKERVSRAHAKITPTGDGYQIENLSGNGTRLNAAMLEQPMPLNGGDRIYIADYTIIYQGDDVPSEKLDEEHTVLGE